ncbi:hypothetical protein [Sphingosinicella terrae]|uniref:hypothetical protein n=1 Tax=Sphingosinicella terrae TaxID=2172047 RepID=UPI000E0D5953|nr:hypothetical protein [Sphingosinicella terrae]
MYRDQNELPAFVRTETEAEARAAALGAALDALCGTLVSEIGFDTDGALAVVGRDEEGELRWRLAVRGSARFTFSHRSGDRRWLVEANYDAGATLRMSERAMILTLCGAVVESFHVDGEGLFIRSDDGRAIEIVHAVSGGEELVIEIAPAEPEAQKLRIVLPDELERWGIDPEAF